MTIKMYVATHKASTFPDDPGYLPIHVGKALTTDDFGIQGDDTGNHISGKNRTFCEMTALYWMMNNCNADVIGLSHYRRYFAPISKSTSFNGFDIAASDDFSDIGKEIDAVVGDPLGFLNDITQTQTSVEQQYFGTAMGFDLHLVRKALIKKCPSYVDAFDFVMRNCQLVPFNMMVGKRAVYREYLHWIFPILFLLEEWIPSHTYDAYQGRVIGFVAERLHTVWVVENRDRYRIAHRPIVFCG